MLRVHVPLANVVDWTPESRCQTYIQPTEAVAAFRIHGSELLLLPVWHQKQKRVQAHILVCFLRDLSPLGIRLSARQQLRTAEYILTCQPRFHSLQIVSTPWMQLRIRDAIS